MKFGYFVSIVQLSTGISAFTDPYSDTLNSQIKNLVDIAKDKKAFRQEKYAARLVKCREDDILLNAQEPQGQGQELVEALERPEVKPIFNRLPEGSLARVVLEVSASVRFASFDHIVPLFATSTSKGSGCILFLSLREVHYCRIVAIFSLVIHMS